MPSPNRRAGRQFLVNTLILSLLMSLLVTGAMVVYFAIGWTTFESEDIEFGFTLLSRLFVFMWPSSIPLSLALLLLHRRSPSAAYLSGAVLVPLTIMGFVVAGLAQSGLLAVAVAALSVPAWIVLLLVNVVRSWLQPEPPGRVH